MDDPGQVQAVVSYLAPFLPYLVAGATEAAKGLGKKAGELVSEGAWKRAQTAWSKVADRLTPKQQAKAKVIAVDPADQAEVASFAHSLVDTLAADPALAAELAALLGKDESAQQVIALNESWVQEVIQKGPGYKLIQADNKSTVIDVRQES